MSENPLSSDPLALLRRCASPLGFLAAEEARANYRRVWARDGVVCGLAALAVGDDPLVDTFETTLRTLGAAAGPAGQIPSNVGADGPPSFGSSAPRLDATAWWLVGIGALGRIADRDGPLEALWPVVERAVAFLRAWEGNEGGLLYVPTAGDWADEYALHGFLLMDSALYRWALAEVHDAAARLGISPPPLARAPDEVPLERLWRDDRYLAGLDPAGAHDQWDALGSALALYGGAPGGDPGALLVAARARLDHDLVPAFTPVVHEGEPGWDALQAAANHGFRNHAGHYHNGGLWPMVAGFWAVAARRHGDRDLAEQLLAGIRAANAQGFPEFLVAGTAAPQGARGQAWSAAGEILAEHGLVPPPSLG